MEHWPPGKPRGDVELLGYLEEWLGDIPFLGDVVEALTGVEDGNNGDLASWANLLLGRDKSLASRVARLENKIAEGAQFFDNYNRGDNDSVLGNGWIQGGTSGSQPLGIHDQAAQIKRDLLPAEGWRWAICPQTTTGNEFSVSGVIHPAGVSDNAPLYLVARANTAFDEGILARFTRNSTRICSFTRTGSTFSLINIATAATKFYSNSATIEFKGADTSLQLLIDNTLVYDITDTAHAIDDAHCTVGFVMRCETAILAFPEYSGGLASFAMRSAVELAAVQAAQATADAASDAGLDNSEAIQTIQTQLTADAAGGGVGTGILFNEPFDGTSLRTAYWSAYNPNGVGVSFGNGEVRPASSGPTGHVYFVRNGAGTAPVYPLMTEDDFDVSVVIGSDLASEQSDSAILFRSNNDATSFGYLNIYEGKCYLGRATRATAGTNGYVITGGADLASRFGVSITKGKRLRITGIGTDYRVYLNGVEILYYPDPTGNITKDSSHRRFGVRIQKKPGLFTYLSGGFASFSEANITPPTFTGTGWHAYRSTNSPAYTATGVNCEMPVFTAWDKSPNIVFSYEPTAQVYIQRNGWYTISAAADFDNLPSEVGIGLQILKGGTGSWITIRRSDFYETVVDISRVHGSWVVYLRAEDHIRPVILSESSTSFPLIGDTDGSRTYFSGARFS